MVEKSRRSVLQAAAVGTASIAGCTDNEQRLETHTDSRDWRFHRHDCHNTNATPATGPRTVPKIQWEKGLLVEKRRGYAYPSPVVADGTVYVGGDGLIALAAESGQERWRVSTDDNVFGPAVVDGMIYAGANTPDGGVVRAYGMDGAVEWESSLPQHVRMRPTMVDDDYVWIPIERTEEPVSDAADPAVLVLDRDSGDRLGVLATGTDHPFPPAVTETVAVVNGIDTISVRAVEPSCGVLCRVLGAGIDEQWVGETAGPWLPPAVDEDRVYVGGREEVPPRRGGYDGVRLRAFRRSDGESIFDKQLGFTVTSPAIHGGTAYVAAMRENDDEDGTAYGTDVVVVSFTTKGAEQWRLELPDRRIWEAPVLADDVLYLGTLPAQTVDAPHQVHAIDPATGERRWDVSIPTSPCTLAVASGTLYACGWEGRLFALA